MLPEEYALVLKVDQDKDKKASWTVMGISVVIAVLMVLFGNVFVPFSTFFDLKNVGRLVVEFIVLFCGLFIYFTLHELIRYSFLKKFGEGASIYFKGMFAAASSKAYLTPRQYYAMNFTPLVILLVVLALIAFLLPSMFWVMYILLIVNAACLVGDIYNLIKIQQQKRPVMVKEVNGVLFVYGELRDGEAPLTEEDVQAPVVEPDEDSAGDETEPVEDNTKA